MPRPALNPPKISTLPRRQSEATILLDLHKLATEKNRLQQELVRLEAREAAIHQRLSQVEAERESLRESQSRFESNRPALPEPSYRPRPAALHRPTPSSFTVTVLDY